MKARRKRLLKYKSFVIKMLSKSSETNAKDRWKTTKKNTKKRPKLRKQIKQMTIDAQRLTKKAASPLLTAA